MKLRHGVILAGGQSKRFGSDKALALYEGKPLIAHAVELVHSAGLDPCVITDRSRDYFFLDCPIYFDQESYLGPLGGLDRAFEVFPDEKVLVLTCDMPFLVKADLDRLLNQNHENCDVVLYRLQTDRLQPFPGIYDASLRGKALWRDEANHSMQFFINKIDQVLEIDAASVKGHFRNINRPADANLLANETGL